MTEWADAFLVWLRSLPPGGIYAVVFVVAWGENVIPPVPGDLVVVVAGSLVALGLVDALPTFGLATAGSVLGFMTVFTAGRRLGAAIHDPTRLRWIPRGALRTSEAWLARWGMGVVAANRFLSGGRAVIGLLVGASGLRVAPVATWATVSALMWNAVLVGGGYWLGNEWPRVVDVLRTYGRTVTVVLVVAAVVFAVRRWRGRSARRDSAAAE